MKAFWVKEDIAQGQRHAFPGSSGPLGVVVESQYRETRLVESLGCQAKWKIFKFLKRNQLSSIV